MIEKLLALVLIMTYVVWSFTTKDVQTIVQNAKVTEQVSVVEEEHVISSIWTQKEAHHAIVDIGEKNGWTMTKFKSNAVIAEKSMEGDSVSITVSFDKSSFTLLRVS